MKRILLAALAVSAFQCSSSLPICDEAVKARLDYNNAVGEQKAMLESKAAGLEEACAKERQRSFEQMKEMNQRNRK